MNITDLFAQRDIQMQLYCLFWVLIGTFLTYVGWKKFGSATPTITFAGAFKKLVIGVAAWGLFLCAYQNIAGLGHIQVILPALVWGVSAEVIVGAFIQQKIESSIAKEVSDLETEVAEEKKEDAEKKEDIKEVSPPKDKKKA